MKEWIKTPFANLYRYGDSGSYHVHAHVKGRLIRRSLKTKSQEIALIKLAELLETERARTVSESDTDMAGVVARVKLRIASTGKPSTRRYKRECIEAVERTDPELFTLPARSMTPDRLTKTADLLREKYSSTRYNGAMTALSEIFDAAKAAGLVAYDPTADIPRAPVPVVERALPEPKQWETVLKKLDAVPHRKHGAVFVRLLSLMGARISAVQKLTVEDCDFRHNEVLVPPVKYDDKPIRLPMFPALRKLLKPLCAERKTGKLVRIGTPRKALEKACRDAGIAPLSPHAMRHLFATRCIESGVDIRTVSAWLGHKDGGALLLKRYAHLRREHSQRMARLVKF